MTTRETYHEITDNTIRHACCGELEGQCECGQSPPVASAPPLPYTRALAWAAGEDEDAVAVAANRADVEHLRALEEARVARLAAAKDLPEPPRPYTRALVRRTAA